GSAPTTEGSQSTERWAARRPRDISREPFLSPPLTARASAGLHGGLEEKVERSRERSARAVPAPPECGSAVPDRSPREPLLRAPEIPPRPRETNGAKPGLHTPKSPARPRHAAAGQPD